MNITPDRIVLTTLGVFALVGVAAVGVATAAILAWVTD